MKNRIISSRSTFRRLLVAATLFVAAFLLVNYVLLPSYVNQGGTLQVPRVTGIPLEAARLALDSMGLEPVEAGTRPDPKAPVGTVVVQNPPHGALVKRGRRVYLTISGGEVLVAVPRLRGLSFRDSRFTLERSGLDVGDVQYDTSDVYPENTVMAQVVPPGSKVSRGTAVGVTISRGKIQAEVMVPDVGGRTLGEAERQLVEKGLKVGNITYQPSFDLLPNTIVDQFPRGGEMVPQGQAVDLFVVNAGKPREEIQPPR
jgi:eukaryotic-like serine/threonine-protein kinase